MRTYEEWALQYQLEDMFLFLPPVSTGFAADLEYFNSKLYESMGIPASVFYDLTNPEEKAPNRYEGYNAIIRAYGRLS